MPARRYSASAAALGDGCRLQWPQGARFVPVSVGVSQPGLPHLLDQNAVAREHLHQSGDDRAQQRVQFVVAGRTGLDEHRHAIGAAPVHPVQHQAVQVDVQVGGGAEALHHLQHRRHQLGLCGQQQSQRDRQREHPLAHRHVRDDVIHQVGGGLRHSPGTA